MSGEINGKLGSAEVPVALLCYCLSSIAMTIMNKYVLSGHKFHLNFALLMVQACKSSRLLKYREMNRQDARAWFPVSLLLVAMIYTGSKSLQYLTVAMFTVFKNITIVCIALSERRLFHSTITPMMWFSFALIVASSLIGAANDLTFNLPGYLWMTTNCAVSAAYILYMRFCIRKVGFEEFDSIFFNNLLAIPVLLILSISIENWSEFFVDYFDGGPYSHVRTHLFLGILASSIFAFAISYTTAWSVRVSSSTTYSMVGALNKLPIAISGMLFFSAERKVVNFGNILSVIIAFSSGILYSLAQINQRRKKNAELDIPQGQVLYSMPANK